MTLVLISVAVVGLLSSLQPTQAAKPPPVHAASLQGFDARKASLALEQGDNPEAVYKKIGQPNQREMKTCGGATNIPPWSCRIETYGARYDNRLTVYYGKKNDGTWAVASWDVG